MQCFRPRLPTWEKKTAETIEEMFHHEVASLHRVANGYYAQVDDGLEGAQQLNELLLRPITHELMVVDTVMKQDGHTYERSVNNREILCAAVQSQSKKRSPATRMVLAFSKLIPNIAHAKSSIRTPGGAATNTVTILTLVATRLAFPKPNVASVCKRCIVGFFPRIPAGQSIRPHAERSCMVKGIRITHRRSYQLRHKHVRPKAQGPRCYCTFI